jgi:serine/threonine protein phosphatase PrpC
MTTESRVRAALWSVGGSSAMGAAHVRHGIPNQDAIAWFPPAGPARYAVLAVSDGHGAPLHFRSGAGAHVAVEAAVAVLTGALSDAVWLVAGDTARAKSLLREIIARWRADVLAHVAKHPLPSTRGDPFVPYGATLLAAAVAPEGILVLQLGDGDLFVGTVDGAILRPLPDDVGMVGEQTYSICMADAADFARTRILRPHEAEVDFLLLSSDGLGKSFATQAALRRHAACWRRLIRLRGVAEVAERLDRWLASASEHGSGDDMTLGFLARDVPVDPAEAARSRLSSRSPGGRTRAGGSREPRNRRSLFVKITSIAGVLAAAAIGYWLARSLP